MQELWLCWQIYVTDFFAPLFMGTIHFYVNIGYSWTGVQLMPDHANLLPEKYQACGEIIWKWKMNNNTYHSYLDYFRSYRFLGTFSMLELWFWGQNLSQNFSHPYSWVPFVKINQITVSYRTRIREWCLRIAPMNRGANDARTREFGFGEIFGEWNGQKDNRYEL